MNGKSRIREDHGIGVSGYTCRRVATFGWPERKESRGYRSEFRYGDFEPEIALPKGATVKDVKSIYSGGILKVRGPCPRRAWRHHPRFPLPGHESRGVR